MSDETQHITTREFDNAVRALTTALGDGFAGINQRVDDVKDELRTMNSKVATQQQAINQLKESTAVHGVLVQEHKRKFDKFETAGFRHQRRDDPPSGDNEPITMKDLKRAVYIAVTAVVLTVGAAVVVMTMILDKRP